MTVILTPREKIVLREICAGESSKEVAYRSFVSLSTIKSQLTSAYQKLTEAGEIGTSVKRKRKDACEWLARGESDVSPPGST